ncbi:MAG: TIGR03013 family PEP-CTERM/XrtA system glycosyltransferase [Thermodesulfobacteriota bacterium]|nr:MAG: TIGR03013 family PEP-CTERM/XrtA system glycosyltransferase [Thermodesulfobacteriota bacterium]
MLFNRHPSKRLLYIALIEGLLIFLAALVSVAIRLSFEGGAMVEYDPSYLKSLVLTAIYLITFYYFDLYTPDMYRPSRYMFSRLIKAMIVAAIIQFSIFYIIPSLKIWRGILLINMLIMPAAIICFRLIFSKILKIKLPGKRVLIIGAGDLAKRIGSEIYTKPEHGLNLVGFIDDDPTKYGVSIVNPGVIGGYGDISRLADEQNIDLIIVALPDRRAKLPMSALLDCKLKGISVEESETFKERLTGKIPLDHLKPSWMVFSDGFRSLRSRKFVKRSLDIVFASLWLVMAAPVMLLTAAIIKLESKGPVIFRQVRVGEHGREFSIYKFRSMRQDAEAKTGPVWAVANDDRVTLVGRIIRKLRIDELPQLVNVLKGDMSFVGPRPERPYFVNKLREEIPYYNIRTVVKPGLTGWAQIKYPYGANMEDAVEKLQYEIFYIKNMSPLLDLMIMFWTIKVVLTGRGAR